MYMGELAHRHVCISSFVCLVAFLLVGANGGLEHTPSSEILSVNEKSHTVGCSILPFKIFSFRLMYLLN
uniref:Putative ovule protein n=1 Tax=Solanum chacoense TaxID=4108 RepID=A0A0V0GRV1_SOLCH